MNSKKLLRALFICLFTCIIFIGPSHADSWYYLYEVKKVGMNPEGAILQITNGTIEVQKLLDPDKEFELLIVALTAYSNGSKVNAHYVSECNCFDAVVIGGD